MQSLIVDICTNAGLIRACHFICVLQDAELLGLELDQESTETANSVNSVSHLQSVNSGQLLRFYVGVFLLKYWELSSWK